MERKKREAWKESERLRQSGKERPRWKKGAERGPGDQDDTAHRPQTWGNTNRDRAGRAGRRDGRVLAGLLS